MHYVTIKQKQQEYQITFEDVLFNRVPSNMFNTGEGKAGTITRIVETPKFEVLDKINVPAIIQKFASFNEKYDHLFKVPRETLYKTFFIPKHSGGMRRIDAPNDELMEALRELKLILENDCGALYHTSAFAYIQDRSIVDALKKHQNNNSNWFLKTDCSNFFGSITFEWTVQRILPMIFPFSWLFQTIGGKTQIKKALSLAFLNGGLPQGTPLSPMLTNILMIPIDHQIFNDLAKKKYVYTRYADDMLISCEQHFDYNKMVDYIRSVLKKFDAPFDLNNEKTRFGSRKGSNWNLGLMLNKDNKITVGHVKKKQFKAMLNNFILDTLHDHPWNVDEIQHFSGVLSYYFMVERDYFSYVIKHYDQKYNVNTIQMIKNQLSI